MPRVIVWDDPGDPGGNAHHLLVTHADRGISLEDVEHVLTHPDTVTTPTGRGYDLYLGPAPDGTRTLLVVAMGAQEVYPITAYPVADPRRYRP